MEKIHPATGLKASSLEQFFQIQEEFRRRLHPLGVTLQQARVLLFLQQCPGAKAEMVKLALILHSSSQTRIVSTLVHNRWVVKTRPTDNPRAVALRLTPRGEKVAQTITERLRDMPSMGA